jgi:Ca2+-binding EF-hand superfamily protein
MLKSALAVLLLAVAANAADDAKKKKPEAKKGPDLEKAFNQLDASSNGKLSLEEFKNLKSAIPQNIDKTTVEGKYDFPAMFKKLDANSDGALDLDEFKKVMDVIPKPEPKKKKAK